MYLINHPSSNSPELKIFVLVVMKNHLVFDRLSLFFLIIGLPSNLNIRPVWWGCGYWKSSCELWLLEK
jgi:hypothetical protein